MVLLVRLCRCTVVMVACGVCFRLVLMSFWCAGEAFVPGRGTLVDGRLVQSVRSGSFFLSVVYSDRIQLHSDRHYHLALERSTRLHTPVVNLK